MVFSVKLLAPGTSTEEIPDRVRSGEISIGDFRERFLTSMLRWSADEYENQWKEAIGRILRGEKHSALITSYAPPADSRYLIWWPMYAVCDAVAFQSQLLFFDQLEEPFSVLDPYRHVAPRRTVDEDGERLSEWKAPLADLQRFIDGCAG